MVAGLAPVKLILWRLEVRTDNHCVLLAVFEV